MGGGGRSGRLSRIDRPGSYIEYQYNARDWLTAVRNRTSAGATLYDVTYSYQDGGLWDHTGSPLLKMETLTGGATQTTTYRYDALAQLLSETRTGPAPYSESYSYDAVGNRLGMTRNGVAYTYSYDDHDKLLSISGNGQSANFGYDLAGNLTAVSGSLFGSWTLEYDWGGRLTSVTYPIPGGSRTDVMQYDVFGQRTSARLQGQGRTYTWFGDRMLAEHGCHYECAYAGALYAGGSYYDPLLARKMGQMEEYPLYDGTGTARGTVNQAGTPQFSWDLDAFGRYLSPYGDSTWFPYRFGGAWGYETDPSGLLQLGARWYWPEIGRFIQQDPIGDGMNWYAYVGNNPVVGLDPTGLDGGPGFWGWLRDQGRAVQDAINGLGHMAIEPFSMDPANLPTFSQRNPGLGDLQRCIGRGEGFDPTVAFGGLANAGLNAGLAAFAGVEWPDPANVFPEALAEAQGRYPKLAGKLNNHHWDPLYMGGERAGPTGELDAALHQVITNANRAKFPYGSGIKPALSERLPVLLEILRGFFRFWGAERTMRMWIQMRVWGNEVLSRLPPGLGREVGSASDREMWRRIDREGVLITRRIDLPADSPIWEQVLGILRDVYGDPRAHYTAFPSFRYARKELLQAEVLRLQVTRAFEPAGEECGTIYDGSRVCQYCGAGRVQVSELHLQLGRQWQALPSLPRTRQFQIARTIADEVIVSRVLADQMQAAGITGAELRPVRACGAKAKETPHWRQLWVTGSAGRTVPPTHFGIDAFRDDEEGKHRCPLGHVSGLNLLSEVHVSRAGWDGNDVSATEDLVGARMGLLVPMPMLLVSQRFHRLLLETNTKGFKVEVAHLV